MKACWLRIIITSGLFLAVSLVIGQNLSSNNKYVTYIIGKQIDSNVNSLIIQSTNNNWKRVIRGDIGSVQFSGDDKSVLYMNKSSLFIESIDGGVIKKIENVSSYKYCNTQVGSYLAYQLNNFTKKVVLQNLDTGDEKDLGRVDHYQFATGSKGLLLFNFIKPGVSQNSSISWVNLVDLTSHKIWNDSQYNITQYLLDQGETKLTFMTQLKNESIQQNQLWYYSIGGEMAELLVDGKIKDRATELLLAKDKVYFNRSGNKIFFKLIEPELPKPDPKWEQYQIWSYLDEKVQTQQIKDHFSNKYVAVIDIKSKECIRLENENEVILNDDQLDLSFNTSDNYALVCRFNGAILRYNDQKFIPAYSMGEYNWNKSTKYTVYLVSLKDGLRIPLESDIKPKGFGLPYYRISPGGKYVVYYDANADRYVKYELATGITENITATISEKWAIMDTETGPGNYYSPNGIVGWIEQDKALIVKDHHGDLWRLEMRGNSQPKNLTNSFCKKNKVSIELVRKNSHLLMVFKDDEKVLIRAKPSLNISLFKNDGYYQVALNKIGNPIAMILLGGNYRYYVRPEYVEQITDSSIFIITRQNSKEPELTFLTQDFKKLIKMEKDKLEYTTSLTQELITWKNIFRSYESGHII